MYSYIWIFFPRSCAMIRQDKRKIYHFTQNSPWMKVRQNYEILICTKMCTCTCGFSFRARHEKYLSNHLLSAPSYCTVTVGCFFMKIHILMKELQWKSIKGKIFKIYLLIHYNFSHEKNHRNKTVLLQRFISGMLTSFLH